MNIISTLDWNRSTILPVTCIDVLILTATSLHISFIKVHENPLEIAPEAIQHSRGNLFFLPQQKNSAWAPQKNFHLANLKNNFICRITFIFWTSLQANVTSARTMLTLRSSFITPISSNRQIFYKYFTALKRRNKPKVDAKKHSTCQSR